MKKIFSLAIAIGGTVGVLSTMIGTAIDNPTTGLLSAFQTLRYFTIQSNLIVIIYFWIIFSLKSNKNKTINDLFGGITVYISITFIVFAIMLSRTWNPNGISQLGNILNHYVIPICTIGFLIYFRKEYHFQFSNVKIWIIYPSIYVLFVLVHGALTQDYLYPFFEIDTVGIWYFIIAIVSIIILFLILSCSFIFLTKTKKNNT